MNIDKEIVGIINKIGGNIHHFSDKAEAFNEIMALIERDYVKKEDNCPHKYITLSPDCIIDGKYQKDVRVLMCIKCGTQDIANELISRTDHEKAIVECRNRTIEECMSSMVNSEMPFSDNNDMIFGILEKLKSIPLQGEKGSEK